MKTFFMVKKSRMFDCHVFFSFHVSSSFKSKNKIKWENASVETQKTYSFWGQWWSKAFGLNGTLYDSNNYPCTGGYQSKWTCKVTPFMWEMFYIQINQHITQYLGLIKEEASVCGWEETCELGSADKLRDGPFLTYTRWKTSPSDLLTCF